jgi:hypothetical protein
LYRNYNLQLTDNGLVFFFYKWLKNFPFPKIQRKLCTTCSETASREVVLVHGDNDVKSGVASRIAETWGCLTWTVYPNLWRCGEKQRTNRKNSHQAVAPNEFKVFVPPTLLWGPKTQLVHWLSYRLNVRGIIVRSLGGVRGLCIFLRVQTKFNSCFTRNMKLRSGVKRAGHKADCFP